MSSDPCWESQISNRVGIKTFGGIFFASDFIKVDIPDVFGLDAEDCRSMYKRTICDSSPLPQNAGIVFSNPCSVDTAAPNISGKNYKTLQTGSWFIRTRVVSAKNRNTLRNYLSEERNDARSKFNTTRYSKKSDLYKQDTYDIEAKADMAEEARSLSFIELRT